MKKLVSLLFGCCCAAAALADVIYVKPTACGTGDGSSWANAKGDLQDAVMAVKGGDEVRVAKGVYYWKSYVDVPAVVFSLFGGYAGEDDDEAPDELANRTIISGDTGKNDQWVVYNLRKRALEGVTTPERTLGPVIVNGELSLPDESQLTDDEMVTIDTERVADNVQIMHCYSGNSGRDWCRPTIRGLWFVSAANGWRGAAIYVDSYYFLAEN